MSYPRPEDEVSKNVIVRVSPAEANLTAFDGDQGVEMAREALPDLILMDLNMPVMDGWTATRMIKSLEETRRIPVVALTAHALAGDREKALEAGCDEYETKPVELQRLEAKMQRLLIPCL